MRVGVIGAGLAGLAAGLELADRGHEVDLLERRPWAGGATYSFRDGETGDEVDNGQHVFMACMTAYRGFLERLGALGRTRRQRRLRVPVLDAAGRRSDLWAANLPFGLHLAPALLRYRHLAPDRKLRVARAFLAIRRLGNGERARLADVTFEAWLRGHGQTPADVREFWDFLVVPTLNCRSARASAAAALFVLEEGFLRGPRSAALGLPATGLSDLHVRPAVRAIRERGGSVSVRSGVERIEAAEGRAAALVRRDGERRAYDAIVSALPPWRLASLLPADPRLAGLAAMLDRFEPMPILNLHLWFDRPVAPFAFAALTGEDAPWVFNRGRVGRERGAGERLALSVSAPDDELFALDREALRERFLPRVRAALPAAREAALLRFLAVKEPRATFLPAPGLARPGPRTALPGFYLAGAWTDTGWPATMESAVRGGLAAAAAVDADARRGHPAGALHSG